jgi:hypothetical protein
VVTGYDASNAPAVFSDGDAPAVVDLPAEVGASMVDLWRSDSLPLDTVGGDDPTLGAAFALMATGTLFRIIDLDPGDHAPLWHTTASVDFIFVAAGDATMLFGDPEAPDSRTLATGDTIVQRGIHHAWVNRGIDTCRIVNVSVAAVLPEGIAPT